MHAHDKELTRGLDAYYGDAEAQENEVAQAANSYIQSYIDGLARGNDLSAVTNINDEICGDMTDAAMAPIFAAALSNDPARLHALFRQMLLSAIVRRAEARASIDADNLQFH